MTGVKRPGARTANGRPPKCSPAMALKAAKMLRWCATREATAHRLGVTPETFANWMKHGARGEQPYYGFFRAVELAEAEAEYTATVSWRRQGQKDWRALERLLAVRFRERWGAQVEAAPPPSVNLLLVQLLQQKSDADVLDLVGRAVDVKALLPAPAEPANGVERKRTNGRARR
ncbi:MAG: hypothetical protein AAB368_06030 [bacterium]